MALVHEMSMESTDSMTRSHPCHLRGWNW